MKTVLAVVVLSVAVSPIVAAADEGFYLGGDVGHATLSGNAYSGFGRKSDASYSVEAGYQFNKYVAAELQYISFGTSYPVPAAPVTTTGYALTAVGMWPLAGGVSAWARFGGANTTRKVTCPNCTPPSYTVARTDVSFGLGLLYRINRTFGIRAGYDQYAIGKVLDKTDGTYTVLSAGVILKF